MTQACSSCINPIVLSQEETDLEFSKLSKGLWILSDNKLKIVRTFMCRNWQAAIDYINKVSPIAEKMGHHPDLALTGYRTITVTIFTHSAAGKGLTIADFELAKELEGIEVDYCPKWLDFFKVMANKL